jgi:hypothetical protein
MGDDYGKDYAAFKAKCEEMGLKDVTEEEWKVHSPSPANARHWGLMTAVRRIKNARRGIGVPKDMRVVIGYPLGGREYVPGDGDLDKSWKQFIPILTKDGLVEVDTEGEYKGQHGAKSEIRYEESTTPRKDGDGFYTNRTIQEVIVGKESVPMSALRARVLGIDDLTRDMLKTPVIVSGVIGDRWYPEKIFEDRKPVDEWAVWLNENPCFQFDMTGHNSILKVRFTPRKISKAMIEVKDFNDVARGGNMASVAQSFSGTPVIVVGILSRWEDARSANGKNYVQLIATAMFEIPADPEQAKLGDPADEEAVFNQKVEAAPVKPAPATPQPAAPPPAPPVETKKPKEVPPLTPSTTPPPSSVQARSAAIREGVRKAAEALGGIDKVTVQAAMEVNKAIWTWGPSNQTIQIAIDREKQKAAKK